MGLSKILPALIKSMARDWKLLSDQSKWKNLLHPLDINLRKYIIHYGEIIEYVDVGQELLINSRK